MNTPQDCILKYIEKTQEVEQTLEDLLTIIQTVSKPEEVEGNSFYCHQSLNRANVLFSKQVNLTWCGSKATEKICEIGFNAGHSAYLLLLLNNNPSLTFTIFDIGEHSYTVPCMNYLVQKFNTVDFKFCKGDSTVTIPAFLHRFPNEKETYDIVHVDGGHSLQCALSDINSAIFLLKPGGYMIIDETNLNYIEDMVNKLVASNDYKEIDILPTVGYKHRIIQKVI